MYCKNCKYWEEERAFSNIQNADIRECTRVKLFWDCTEWGDGSNNYQRVLTKDAEDDKAFVQDASDYSAQLLTLEDFGCNQFEAKEDKQ